MFSPKHFFGRGLKAPKLRGSSRKKVLHIYRSTRRSMPDSFRPKHTNWDALLTQGEPVDRVRRKVVGSATERLLWRSFALAFSSLALQAGCPVQASCRLGQVIQGTGGRGVKNTVAHLSYKLLRFCGICGPCVVRLEHVSFRRS